MPREKEMRVWLIGILLGTWVLLAWLITDYVFWTPEGTPQEVIPQLARKVETIAYAIMAMMIIGLVMLTRVAYGLLRARPEMPDGQAHYQ